MFRTGLEALSFKCPSIAAKNRNYADLTSCGIDYAQLAVPNIRQLVSNDLRFCQRVLIAIEDLPGFIRATVLALLEVNEVAHGETLGGHWFCCNALIFDEFPLFVSIARSFSKLGCLGAG